MSQFLDAAATRRPTIAAADDPYKKYWFGILLFFAVGGAWVWYPMMEGRVGDVHVDAPNATVGGEQSLDSAVNPSGAPGAAIGDGKGGAGKNGAASSSSLYQASSDGGTAGKTSATGGDDAAAASAAKAAAAAEAARRKKAQWDGEKAQRGFTSPNLSGGSLSGAGSTSGGAGASASSGFGAFGSHVAHPGMVATSGLGGGVDDAAAIAARRAGISSMAALRAAASASAQAANQRSGDAASAGMNKQFDGAQSRNPIKAGGDAGSPYAAIDAAAAPVNLKANDPTLDKREEKAPPPSKPVEKPKSGMDSQQLGMMLATAMIGGLMPGVGGMLMPIVMSQMQAGGK